MRYLLLIYDNEANVTDDAEMERWFAYDARLRDSGSFVAGEALQPTTTATTVRAGKGGTVTTDGPFAETKEQLGGFYLVDCSDLDEALRWAAEMPHMDRGTVEVRPVLDFSQE